MIKIKAAGNAAGEKTEGRMDKKENKLPALSIDRKGFETCWAAMTGIANCIFSIIRQNKKVRIVIEYDPENNRVYFNKEFWS